MSCRESAFRLNSKRQTHTKHQKPGWPIKWWLKELSSSCLWFYGVISHPLYYFDWNNSHAIIFVWSLNELYGDQAVMINACDATRREKIKDIPVISLRREGRREYIKRLLALIKCLLFPFIFQTLCKTVSWNDRGSGLLTPFQLCELRLVIQHLWVLIFSPVK